jgi:ADP-ribose pyrophosphatase YjhB (NUDIX family)
VPSYYQDPDAPTPNAPHTIGVTALIERNGRCLVERRASDTDVWAFIGGTLEPDEPVLAALRREVLEETGFAVETAELLGVFSDPTRIVAYPNGRVCRVVSIAFRVAAAGEADPVLSEESAEMRFVERRELASLPFWPIHLPLRDALLADTSDPVVA